MRNYLRAYEPNNKNKKLLFYIIGGIGAFLAVIVVTFVGIVLYFNAKLPDYTQLVDYTPPTLTQVYDDNLHPMFSFAQQKRQFVSIKNIPKKVQDAFLAAEDKNFYSHIGIDFGAIFSAAIKDVAYYIEGKRLIGASTITQQVAKNFLLSNDYSFVRKIKEAILAVKIDTLLTKQRVLELYLNQIYLGNGAYGVSSAAKTYFQKPLSQLTIAEAAYLAGLPKGPSLYTLYLPNGQVNPKALQRRNWVISRMSEDNFITEEEANNALKEPIIVDTRPEATIISNNSYFISELRKELIDKFGYVDLYGGGYIVYTTYDAKIQDMALTAFQKGLLTYDKRHGYRGPVTKLNLQTDDWEHTFLTLPFEGQVFHWQLALVVATTPNSANIVFQNSTTATIFLENVQWARAFISDNIQGASVHSVQQVLHRGDVIYVSKKKNGYALEQIPAINGGMIVMEAKTGKIRAMIGGWQNDPNQFNRATQAKRQLGSVIKPFVYAAALNNNYHVTSYILDNPMVYTLQNKDTGEQSIWVPKNSNHNYVGPSFLMNGMIFSRNLMTIRIAQQIGIGDIRKIFTSTELYKKSLKKINLAMTIGAKETTLLNLVTAFSTIANNGYKVKSTLIERIQDTSGKNVYSNSLYTHKETNESDQYIKFQDTRERILDPEVTYGILTALQRVPKYGTGRRLRNIKVPMAGKTGTSNQSRDTWYVGIVDGLVVATFVGFDSPHSLGTYAGVTKEQGASVDIPIFKRFLEQYIQEKNIKPFHIPNSVDIYSVDAKTGTLQNSNTRSIIEVPYPKGIQPNFYPEDSSEIESGVPSFPSGLY